MPRDAVTKFLSGCHLCQKSSSPIPLLDVSLDSVTDCDIVCQDESLSFNQSHNDSHNNHSVEKYEMTNHGVPIALEENNSFESETNMKEIIHSNTEENTAIIRQHLIENEGIDEVNKTLLAYYQLLLAFNGKTPKIKTNNNATEINHTMKVHNGGSPSLIKEWTNSSESVKCSPERLSDKASKMPCQSPKKTIIVNMNDIIAEHLKRTKNHQCDTPLVSK